MLSEMLSISDIRPKIMMNQMFRVKVSVKDTHHSQPQRHSNTHRNTHISHKCSGQQSKTHMTDSLRDTLIQTETHILDTDVQVQQGKTHMTDSLRGTLIHT